MSFLFLASNHWQAISMVTNQSSDVPHPQNSPLRVPPALQMRGDVAFVSLPEDGRQRSSVLYYLPERLVDELSKQFSKRLNGAKNYWDRERQLAEHFNGNLSSIGDWGGDPLRDSRFTPWTPLPRLSKAEMKEFGLAPSEFDLRQAESRLRWIRRASRSYTGWLVTHTPFLNEQDELLHRLEIPLRCYGFGLFGPTLAASIETPNSTIADLGLSEDQAHSILNFLTRWRLNSLNGPDLPIPLEPNMIGTIPQTSVARIVASGGLFHIPDTYPIPGREELRDMIASGRASHIEHHLSEWSKITAKGQSAQNQLDTFDRIRELIHFWRVLRGRHRSLFDRNFQCFYSAFAAYFGVKENTIRGNLRKISARCGKSWQERKIPLTELASER